MKMYAWFQCFLYFDVFGGGEAGLTEDVLQAFLSLVLLHHIYVASCNIYICCVDSLSFDDLRLLSCAVVPYLHVHPPKLSPSVDPSTQKELAHIPRQKCISPLITFNHLMH